MKKLKFLILLVGLLAFNSLEAGAGQITKNVTFDPSKLTIRYDTIGNVAYAKINYEGMVSVNSQGLPVLPSKILLFSVPYNADDFDVQCNVISYNEYQLNADVYPGPKMIETNDSSFVVYNQKDSIIYGTNSFYPDTLFRALDAGFMHGSNRVLKSHLNPLYYNPATKTLRLATSMQLVINYNVNLSIRPTVVRHNNEIIEKEQMLTKSCVQNGEDVVMNAFAEATVETPSLRTGDTIPTYNYCIITSRELAPSFKKIIAMKRQKGLSAGTVCIEDLMASPLFNTGDVNYNVYTDETYVLTDSAGVVRNYLKYAFSSANDPTSYVLMGGRKGYSPVRKLESSISTDMYFSDLAQIWDNNNYMSIFYANQYYYPIVYTPDLYVGRLLCSNKSEIDNYSEKLYRYAFNPRNGDMTYLTRGLFFSSPQYYDNMGASVESSFFLNNNEMDPTDHMFTGSDIINELNATKYGYISGCCGGDSHAMDLYFTNYLLTALDEYVPINQNTVNETGNGLDNLTNKKFPAIFSSLSSRAISFDDSSQYNHLTLYANNYNFGESFTVGGKYGGIAFLGNTLFGVPDWSFPIEVGFFNSMRTKNDYHLGVSEANSKLYYAYNYSTLSYGYFNEIITSHNLIGDPEVEMWTNNPQQYSGITVSQYNNYIFVNGISASDTISYCDNNGNVGRVYGFEGSTTLSGISPNSCIMVYNHDYIPYIAPLLLQNCNITNSQYVYASTFSAGKSILPDITHGNVTIKNGAVYEIEATGDVHLGKGFHVENGATFAIKTPGKVTIDGCVFQSGARVKIEAGKVEIAGKFIAERGSKVEFTQFVDW